MEFQDKSLRCVDCGSEFIWTAGEQLFFADKQFKNEPKRCKTCKAKRANRVSAGPHRSGTGSRHRPSARHAARKRQCLSDPRRDARCSARSASSNGSSLGLGASETGSVDSDTSRNPASRRKTVRARRSRLALFVCARIRSFYGRTFEELCRSRNNPPVM